MLIWKALNHFEGMLKMYLSIEYEDPEQLLREDRKSVLQELEEAEKMSPELKRYWRQRAEEKKEENFYW